MCFRTHPGCVTKCGNGYFECEWGKGIGLWTKRILYIFYEYVELSYEIPCSQLFNIYICVLFCYPIYKRSLNAVVCLQKLLEMRLLMGGSTKLHYLFSLKTDLHDFQTRLVIFPFSFNFVVLFTHLLLFYCSVFHCGCMVTLDSGKLLLTRWVGRRGDGMARERTQVLPVILFRPVSVWLNYYLTETAYSVLVMYFQPSLPLPIP